MANQKHNVVPAFELGAEGGNVTLLARMNADGPWQYRVRVDESTLADLLPGEFAEEDLVSESGWVDSWHQALSLLDKYDWPRLGLLTVHPAFVARVIDAYESRSGANPLLNRKWGGALSEHLHPAGQDVATAAYSPRIDRALIVASIAHSNCNRKGTHIPYVSHPAHVARLLERHGYDENVVIAGFLHDVIEDFDTDDGEVKERFRKVFPRLANIGDDRDFAQRLRTFLEEEFGPGVMDLVDAVTERKRESGSERPWIDRKMERLEYLRETAPRIAALKCADALHNAASVLRDMHENIADGGRSVLNRFNASPDQLLWYYGTIAAQVGGRLAPQRRALQTELEGVVAAMEQQVDQACGPRDVFTGARERPVKRADATRVVLGKNGRQIYSFDQWRRYAPPAKGAPHWKDFRSAKEMARAWLGGLEATVPPPLAGALETCEAFRGFAISTLRPEHETRLDNLGKGRQHDLVLYGTVGPRRAVVCIEGKADETFGLTIDEELARPPRKDAKGPSRIGDRINALSEKVFGRRPDAQLGTLRFQLLHALAGTMIEGEKTDIAALVVHEFVSSTSKSKRLASNDSDFASFMRVVTGVTDPVIGTLYPVVLSPSAQTRPQLYIGKVQTQLAKIPKGEHNG